MKTYLALFIVSIGSMISCAKDGPIPLTINKGPYTFYSDKVIRDANRFASCGTHLHFYVNQQNNDLILFRIIDEPLPPDSASYRQKIIDPIAFLAFHFIFPKEKTEKHILAEGILVFIIHFWKAGKYDGNIRFEYPLYYFI